MISDSNPGSAPRVCYKARKMLERLECTDQKIFVDLLVAVIRRKESSAMKWRQSFAITLVDHRSIVKQMMQLYTKTSNAFTDSAVLTISSCL